LSTADWRRFARQPSGFLTVLALVLLLAFRIPSCPMLADVDPAPPDAHGCCHGTAATPDTPPAAPASPNCHTGPCLQVLDVDGGFNGYWPSASEPNKSTLVLVAAWLPPDWLGQGSFSPPFLTALGPPPSQRSLILRL